MHEKYKTDIFSLKLKTFRGISLLIAREFFIKALATIGQIILVLFLAPEYFGIFAIITFIISFFELFTDISFNQAIIRKKDKPDYLALSTIFFVREILTILSVVILFIFASYIVSFFSSFSTNEVLMIRVFSLTLLLKPLRSIIISILERELRYDIIPRIDIIGVLVYYIAVIFFSINHFYAWSFIWAVFIKEVVESAVAFCYHPWFPRFSFRFSSIKDMIKYGSYLQLGTVISFIHKSIIPVIAGNRTSPYEVGLLDWSMNIASIPRSITDNYGRVSFAAFSRIQSNRRLLSMAIEKSFGIISVICIFFSLITLGFGRELIQYILTNKWLPALPALNWFIGSIIFIGGTASFGQALIAIGKTKEILIVSTIVVIAEWFLSYTFLSIWNFTGIAMASFIGSLALFVLYIFLGRKNGLSVNLKNTFIYKSVLFCLMILLITLINYLLHGSLLFLILKLILVSTAYLLFSYLLCRNEVIEIFILIKQTLKFIKK